MDADGNKSPVDAICELRRRTPCRNLPEPVRTPKGRTQILTDLWVTWRSRRGRLAGCPLPPATAYIPDMIQIVIVQQDGGRALVVGKPDRVPVITGGRACKLEVHATDTRVLRAEASRPDAG